MFDLIRIPEGEISREEFIKAILFLFALSLFVFGLDFLLTKLNSEMVWMTTAVSPFLGLVEMVIKFSILYFWVCIFLKRLRATGHSLYFVYSLIGMLFAAPVLQLIAYQFSSLAIPDGGFVMFAYYARWLLYGAALALFALLLFFGLRKKDATKA